VLLSCTGELRCTSCWAAWLQQAIPSATSWLLSFRCHPASGPLLLLTAPCLSRPPTCPQRDVKPEPELASAWQGPSLGSFHHNKPLTKFATADMAWSSDQWAKNVDAYLGQEEDHRRWGGSRLVWFVVWGLQGVMWASRSSTDNGLGDWMGWVGCKLWDQVCGLSSGVLSCGSMWCCTAAAPSIVPDLLLLLLLLPPSSGTCCGWWATWTAPPQWSRPSRCSRSPAATWRAYWRGPSTTHPGRSQVRRAPPGAARCCQVPPGPSLVVLHV
jgi:hypothetical protein